MFLIPFRARTRNAISLRQRGTFLFFVVHFSFYERKMNNCDCEVALKRHNVSNLGALAPWRFIYGAFWRSITRSALRK